MGGKLWTWSSGNGGACAHPRPQGRTKSKVWVADLAGDNFDIIVQLI